MHSGGGRSGAPRWRGALVGGLVGLIASLFVGCTEQVQEAGRLQEQPISAPPAPAYAAASLSPITVRAIAGLPPLLLSAGGSARVVIVPAPGMPYYQEVAEFLADYLRQATGVEFTIAANQQQQPPEGDAIYVGPVERPGTTAVLARALALAPEHFLVERVPGGVILVGNDRYRAIDTGRPLTITTAPSAAGMSFCSKGTYLAAVDFLERFVGVRWYFLGPLGTCVPDWRGKALQLPALGYEDGPCFADRRAFAMMPAAAAGAEPYNRYYPQNEYRQWGNRTGAMVPVKAQHTDCDWHKLYALGHPEYFALRADGSRMTGNGPEMYAVQRCYSNEAGFQQHLANIGRYLATGEGAESFTDRLGECLPNREFIYWAPNDSFVGCACADCQALIDQDAPIDDRYSRLIWGYTARLGRAVQQRWPGRKLCVFASYSGATTIPEDLQLPDNLLLTLCLGAVPECYMKEPAYRQVNQEMLDRAYRRSGRKVQLWTYPNQPYYSMRVPYPTFAPHVLAAFIKANQAKLSGVFTQEFYPLNALGQALYARLLWNPDLAVDAFLAEYSTLMFGPAAPDMQRYLALGIARWEDTRWSYLPPPIEVGRTIPEQLIWQETYPPAVRREMQALLAAALAAVPGDGRHRQRVEQQIAVAAPFFEAGRSADETVRPVVDGVQLATPPVVDGDLAEWARLRPVVLKGWKGGAVGEKTEILVARDASALYLAGRVHESAGAVLADPAKAGDLFGHDSVELYLCPEQVGLAEAGMAQSGQFFQIAINARGETVVNRKTLQRADWGPPEAFAFTSAVRAMGQGFQFELRIPYASLGAPVPREWRSEWPVNFYRNRPRGADPGYQAWSPTMGKAFFNTASFGTLRFPPRPLYAVDLTAQVAAASVHRAEGLAATLAPAAAGLVLNVRSLAGQRDVATPYLNLGGIPVLPLSGPVIIELAFRYQGRGVAGVGLHVKDSFDDARHRNVAACEHLPAHAAAQAVDSDWILARMQVPASLKDLAYWDLGLSVAPAADFRLEIGHITVWPAPP